MMATLSQAFVRKLFLTPMSRVNAVQETSVLLHLRFIQGYRCSYWLTGWG